MNDSIPSMPVAPAKKSFSSWAKEKLSGADVVAVGVNFVVGALLVGGIVGAAFMQEQGVSTKPPVNAALSAPEDVSENETALPDGIALLTDDESREGRKKGHK